MGCCGQTVVLVDDSDRECLENVIKIENPVSLQNQKKNENPESLQNLKRNENSLEIPKKNDKSEKKEISDFNDIDEQNKFNSAFLNYIEFYNDLFNELKKQKQIYLVETDFFKTNIKKLDLNTQSINLGIVKEKIHSEKLEIPKNKLKFINSKKDMPEISSNIEILNDNIVKDLTTDNKEYFDKGLKYKIELNNEIDIILVDTIITIKKENFNIYIKDNNEKLNSINLDYKDNEIGKTSNNESSTAAINSESLMNQEDQKNQKKIINVLNEVNEINEYNDEILSKDSDLMSNNFNMQMNKNLISISYKNDEPKFTVIGKHLDNSIYLGENGQLKEKYEIYHKYYKELFEELENIDKLLSCSIDSKNIYDDYVMINKSYFNKLIKLFEPISIYNDESIIIDSYDKLTKFKNLEININQFNNRLKNLKKASIQLEVESLKNTKYKYPKKFLLIKKDLLLNFSILEKNFKLNIFKLLFGENHLFIKLRKSLIVCSKENLFFNVNYVFIYFHRFYFQNELIPNIQGKEGFNYFFSNIGFDILKSDIFRHIDENEGTLSEIFLIKYRDDLKFTYLILIMLSLSNITQLVDNLSNYANTGNGIISMFIQFIRMKKENFNNKETMKIINEMLEYINNYKIDTNLNNFQILLDIILDNMHEQLNTKKINEDEFPFESKDKNYAINQFKKNYDTQNESIIKKLFFGLALETIIPSCNCNEKNYQCELIKYIYLEQDKTQKYNNLEVLLNNWGISKIAQYHCKKCNIICEASTFKEIKEYPEILIIILNDSKGENKKSVKFPQTLNVKNFSYKYKVSSIISSQAKNDNFNIISKDKNDEFIINDITGKEKIGIKDISTYSKYPRVIFYERTEKKENKFEKTHTEVGISQFFIESEKTHSLNFNTRLQNSMAYLNDEESCENELFKYDHNDENKKEINDEYNISHGDNVKISKDPDGALFVLNKNNDNNKINNNNFGNKNINVNNINNMNQNNDINFGNNNTIEKPNNISDSNISFSKNPDNNNLINLINNFQNNDINSMNSMSNNMLGFSNKNNINNNILFNNCNNINYQMKQENFNKNVNMVNNNQRLNLDDKLQPFQANIPKNNVNNFNPQIQSKFNNKISNKISLVFKFFTGEEYYLYLNDDNITLGNAIYYLMHQYPGIKDKKMDKIHLLYNGIVLNDINKTIREYGLKDGDTILVNYS